MTTTQASTAAQPKIQIITFYKFIALSDEQVERVRQKLNALETSLAARGLCIMGREGVNATFSVPLESATDFKNQVQEILQEPYIQFKDSFADFYPFHDFKIKIRQEIVTLDRPDLVPHKRHHHLSPEDWHKALQEKDVIVIDTRNSYEFEIGRFRNALDPKTRNFNEFPQWVKNELPKHLSPEAQKNPTEQKILIYCTGGIRCEKAILEMEEQGYTNVYQLDGGILNYIEKSGGLWDGECFVFDYRVAVDNQLQPSQTYKLCPHCGQPGKTKITCVQCKVDVVVCEHCLDLGEKEELAKQAEQARARNQYHTCSKNCAHHFRMGHRTKRIHVEAFKKRRPTA